MDWGSLAILIGLLLLAVGTYNMVKTYAGQIPNTGTPPPKP